MEDMTTRMGRLSDAPIRAVSNGDGTYSMAVVNMGDDTHSGTEIITLLTAIKAELVTLNANLSANAEVDFL